MRQRKVKYSWKVEDSGTGRAALYSQLELAENSKDSRAAVPDSTVTEGTSRRASCIADIKGRDCQRFVWQLILLHIFRSRCLFPAR
jgi:hypothetical protein